VIEVGLLPWLESRPYADLAGLPDLAYFPAVSHTDRLVAVRAHIRLFPVGVAVAALLGEGRARLLAFKIRDGYDEPGTRSRLLQSLEIELEARGCTIVDYAYYRELDRQASLLEIPWDESSMFQTAGWSAGQPASVVLTFSERIGEAPWIKSNRPIPPDLEIFPWVELPAAEKEQIPRLVGKEPGMAALDPTLSQRPCFPAASFGLRHAGTLAGWCITVQVGPGTLHYTSFFVERRLRLTEAPLVLMRETIKRHFELKDSFPCAVQTIPVGLAPILRFAHKKLAPWADKMEGLFVTYKQLGGSNQRKAFSPVTGPITGDVL
jgi:hypothetical protein